MRCELVRGGSFLLLLLLFFTRCMWRICNLSNMSIRTATSLGQKNRSIDINAWMCGIFQIRVRYGSSRMKLFYIHLFSADGCVCARSDVFFFSFPACLECLLFAASISTILQFSVHFIYHFEHSFFFFFLLLVVALWSLVFIVSHSIYLCVPVSHAAYEGAKPHGSVECGSEWRQR